MQKLITSIIEAFHKLSLVEEEKSKKHTDESVHNNPQNTSTESIDK